MNREPHRLIWAGEEPAVDQGMENGLLLSWNPDDGKFYVWNSLEEKTLARFARFANAVGWARKQKLSMLAERSRG